MPDDVSQNGERESHKSLIKELYKLKEAGKKVYIFTVSHDYNECLISFNNDELVPIESVSYQELYDLYYDFGYSEALAVNCDRSDDAKGIIDDRLLEWLQVQLEEAKKDGFFIFAINHYPVVPCVPVFDIVGDAQVRNCVTLLPSLHITVLNPFLRDICHIQSINEYYSNQGNRLIDVCTSATVGSPMQYRKIEISDDALMTVASFYAPDFRRLMSRLILPKCF